MEGKNRKDLQADRKEKKNALEAGIQTRGMIKRTEQLGLHKGEYISHEYMALNDRAFSAYSDKCNPSKICARPRSQGEH